VCVALSFEGLRERMRLSRVPEDIKCVAVLIIGNVRYEQDRQSLRLDFRTTFPDRGLNHEDIMEQWADRSMKI
jgi:hypothetical protein